jgi:hypothetical protein
LLEGQRIIQEDGKPAQAIREGDVVNIHPDVNTCMVPNRIAGLFYGPFTNEELVGEALALYRYEVVITTNFGFRIRNGKEAALDSRQEHIKKAVEGSLKRFGVETMLGWQAIWHSS